MVGIGIITRDALPLLAECVKAVRHYTLQPYRLAVGDDASTDGTPDWCARERVRCLTGLWGGADFNRTKLLYHFAKRTRCDPILLLEVDAHPCGQGRDLFWTEGARRWGHVAFAFGGRPDLLSGCGFPEDPFRCVLYGAQ